MSTQGSFRDGTPESNAISEQELADRVISFFIQKQSLDAAAKLGLLSIAVPPSYGGLYVSAGSRARVYRGIESRNHLMGETLNAHYRVCAAVHAWGTPAQRDFYLPRLASGAQIGMLMSDSLHVSKDDEVFPLWGDTTSTGMYTENGLALLHIFRHNFAKWLVCPVELLVPSRKTTRGKMTFHLKECRVPQSCLLHDAEPNVGYQGRNRRWRIVPLES